MTAIALELPSSLQGAWQMQEDGAELQQAFLALTGCHVDSPWSALPAQTGAVSDAFENRLRFVDWFLDRARDQVASILHDIVLPWAKLFRSTCDIDGPEHKLVSSIPVDIASAASDFLRKLQQFNVLREETLRVLGADEVQLSRHRRQVQGQLLVHLPREFERFVAAYTRTAFRAFCRAEPIHRVASSVLRERPNSEPRDIWWKASSEARRLLNNTESRYTVDPDAGKYAVDLDAAALYLNLSMLPSASESDAENEGTQSVYESDDVPENEETLEDAEEDSAPEEDYMETEDGSGKAEQEAVSSEAQVGAEEVESEGEDGEECEQDEGDEYDDEDSQDVYGDVNYANEVTEGGDVADNERDEIHHPDDAKHVVNLVAIYESLCSMGLDDFSLRVFLPVTFDEAAALIQRKVRCPLNQNFVEWVRAWLRTVAASWFGLHWASKRTKSGTDLAECVQWCARLEYFAYEALCESRIGQLWNIIHQYPYSEPALLDLKWCLEKTGHRKELVQALSADFKHTLLHPGVETKRVLSQYVNCIKCLRIIDPSGVLLDAVSGPIGACLRSRRDTVKETITMLLEDENLGLSGAGDADEAGILAHLNYDENFSHLNWMPSPIDEPPTFNKRSRCADVVSLLVSVFESADDIIKEFQSVLAGSLLQMTGFDVTGQKRHLELLKMRFDKGSMQNCDVMLRDIMESRRIGINVNNVERAGERPVCVLETKVISANFWPKLGDHTLILPPEIRNLMEEHQRAFEAQKGARKLDWKASLGTVSLDLELQGRTLSFHSIQPAEAVVIHHFQEKHAWNVVDLAIATGLTMDVVRRTIGFWEEHQLLVPENEDRNVFVLREDNARMIPNAK